MVDDYIASLPCGVGAHNTLHGHHLPDKGVLVLVRVKGDVRLVKVWISLKEVLLPTGGPVRCGPGGSEEDMQKRVGRDVTMVCFMPK